MADTQHDRALALARRVLDIECPPDFGCDTERPCACDNAAAALIFKAMKEAYKQGFHECDEQWREYGGPSKNDNPT